MKKLLTIFLLVSVGLFASDFTPRKSKKCKENRKKITKLRKTGVIKL